MRLNTTVLLIFASMSESASSKPAKHITTCSGHVRYCYNEKGERLYNQGTKQNPLWGTKNDELEWDRITKQAALEERRQAREAAEQENQFEEDRMKQAIQDAQFEMGLELDRIKEDDAIAHRAIENAPTPETHWHRHPY